MIHSYNEFYKIFRQIKHKKDKYIIKTNHTNIRLIGPFDCYKTKDMTCIMLFRLSKTRNKPMIK